MILALIKRLASRHRVHVFALAQEAVAGSWELAGATIHNSGRPFTVVRTLQAIRRQHGREPFDVVHSIWAGSCGFIAAVAGSLLGLPVLVHLAGGELVALPAIRYGGRLHWYRRVVDSWTLGRAARITAASSPMIEAAATFGLEVVRVPLGIDLESWPVRAPVRRVAGSPARLLHVASLNRVKDQVTLLAALRIVADTHRDLHLDIVGEDTLDGEIQQLAGRWGLSERVRFHGFLEQARARPVVEAAHINVVSSLHEAGPIVALEAAVAGLPTVGTAVGHLVEWAPHAALTAKPGDAQGLAAQIERLLDDEELRLKLAANAQQIATREHAGFTADRFELLYRELTPG